MNSEPVSIRMLLMPLNTAMAMKARRQAVSAVASSAVAGAGGGSCRSAYHFGARNGTARPLSLIPGVVAILFLFMMPRRPVCGDPADCRRRTEALGCGLTGHHS